MSSGVRWQQTLAAAPPDQRVARSTAIQGACNAPEGDNETQNMNAANPHPRAATNTLQKLHDALPPELPSLSRRAAEGSTSAYSSFSGSSTSSHTKCTVAVVVAPSSFSAVSHIPARGSHSRSSTASLSRDQRLLMSPLRDKEVESTAMPPKLEGGVMDAEVWKDESSLRPGSGPFLHTAAAWSTLVEDITANSQLFINLNTPQLADTLANTPPCDSGAAEAVQSPAAPVPQTPPAVDTLVLETNKHASGRRTPSTATDAGESSPVSVSTAALTTAVDCANDTANAPHSSRIQVHCPPTPGAALLHHVHGASDSIALCIPSAAAALQLPQSSSGAITAANMGQRTPATRKVDEGRRLPSYFTEHRMNVITPDSQLFPLSHITYVPLSPLGSPPEESRAADDTTVFVASGYELAEAGSEESGKFGDIPASGRCMTAMLKTKTTPLSSLSPNIQPENPRALSASATATAQRRGVLSGNAQRKALDSRCLSRDGALGPPSVPIHEALADAPLLGGAASDVAADTVVAMPLLAASAQQNSPNTTFRQKAVQWQQDSPPPAEPPLPEPEALVPPPTTKAPMQLSASFPAREALSLDGTLRTCADDVALVANIDKGTSLSTTLAFGATAGTAASSSLFDSSAWVPVESSAMRKRAYGGAQPALPVQQTRPARQSPLRSPLSMRPDVFQQGGDARAAVASARPTDGRTVSTSSKRASCTATPRHGDGVLPRDDGTAALQQVPALSQELLVPYAQSLCGGGIDAPLTVTMGAQPERDPHVLCVNLPGQAADTASQLPLSASKSATAVSQLAVNASSTPAKLVADSQTPSANISKYSVMRSNAAARQAPSPSAVPQPPTMQSELKFLHVSPTHRTTETAHATQRPTTVSPCRSAERHAAVSGGARETRPNSSVPSCPPEVSAVRVNVRAIASASPHSRASAFERRDAPSTPQCTGHRRSSTGTRNELRSAARTMSSVSEAPLDSFAHITHDKQAQKDLYRLSMCSPAPPGPSPRRAAHTAPLPARITATSAAASSSRSPEMTPLWGPVGVGNAVAEDGALSITPVTINTAGGNIPLLAASEVRGVRTGWTPTELVLSQPLPASPQAAAEAEVVPGAYVGKPSTAEIPLPTADIPTTQTEVLNTHTACASNTVETAATMRCRDASDASAAASPAHHDCRGVRMASRRDDRRDAALAAKMPHTPLPSHVLPSADNSLKHFTAPQERHSPPTCRRARGGGVPAAMVPFVRLPVSESATVTPFARGGTVPAGVQPRRQTTAKPLAAAAATVTHALPVSSGPSWEKMERLPVGHPASATPAATLLLSHTCPLRSVSATTADAQFSIPHRVPASPLPSSFQQQCTPQGGDFTNLKPVSVPHPPHTATPELFRQHFGPTTLRQRGKGALNGAASDATFPTPAHSLPTEQLAGCAAASTPHLGEAACEVLPDTHVGSCKGPNPASSCLSSVASSCLQQHQLQAGWRSGLPRFLLFSAVTREPMPMETLGPKSEIAMRRPFSTESSGGDSGRQARPVLHHERQVSPRGSRSPWQWWRGQNPLTPQQSFPGREHRHVHGAQAGDFSIALSPNLDQADDTDSAAAPHCRPTFSSSITREVAGGGGTAGNDGGVDLTACCIPAAPTPLKLRTAHLDMTRERADARTGVSVVNSTTSGCATAGQPLYNVVAAAPTSSPRTATIVEVATPVRACTSSLLTGVAKYYNAYQRTQQPRSMKSGPLPSSQMFHFQPSMDTGSLSPQNDRGGEARGNTGTISGPGLLPVAGAGMTLPATAAAGPSEPRRHYHHSGTPLQRCSDGANAGLRNAGRAKGDYGPQRVPRLTRALLDELQRSYAAAADASSRPCDLPINLPLKEALVISWRDAVDHGAHSGNDCSGASAMLRSLRFPSPARGHRVENVTAVLPSSEWTAAYSMQKPQSPPPQLHATPDAAPMNTRPDSPMAIRPDLTAPAPRERLCRQRYTSSPSPAPVAPPPVMLENHGAVLRAPHPQKLPLVVSPQKAQPHLHRRNLVERPAGKHTTHGSGDTPKSVPAVLQETTCESGEVLKTQPPLAPLEHQRTPVLTSVAIGLAAPPPAPQTPKGNTQGASTETVSVTEGCPMQRSSGQRIRNFFHFFRGRQGQPRRGRAWVAHG